MNAIRSIGATSSAAIVAGGYGPRPDTWCKGDGQSAPQVHVADSEGYWKMYSQHTMEMVVTREGRRLFPRFRFNVKGLNPTDQYKIYVSLVPADSQRYKYDYRTTWTAQGTADKHKYEQLYCHPDSPSTGEAWSRQTTICFDKLKITNQEENGNGHIPLHTMQKYCAKIYIVKVTPSLEEVSWSYTFPETSFIAVTTYNNDIIRRFKVRNNAFAKAHQKSQDGSKFAPQLSVQAATAMHHHPAGISVTYAPTSIVGAAPASYSYRPQPQAHHHNHSRTQSSASSCSEPSAKRPKLESGQDYVYTPQTSPGLNSTTAFTFMDQGATTPPSSNGSGGVPYASLVNISPPTPTVSDDRSAQGLSSGQPHDQPSPMSSNAPALPQAMTSLPPAQATTQCTLVPVTVIPQPQSARPHTTVPRYTTMPNYVSLYGNGQQIIYIAPSNMAGVMPSHAAPAFMPSHAAPAFMQPAMPTVVLPPTAAATAATVASSAVMATHHSPTTLMQPPIMINGMARSIPQALPQQC